MFLWQYWAGYLVHFLAILVFHSAVDADWSSLKVLAFLHLAAHGLAAAGCSGPEFGPGECFFWGEFGPGECFFWVSLVLVSVFFWVGLVLVSIFFFGEFGPGEGFFG